ncbi:hypothetical protein DIPPA_15464 [Diplonema papillatum]|nr:hypothetical protein DIPPA_15464 [Diplonema papillatum]
MCTSHAFSDMVGFVERQKIVPVVDVAKPLGQIELVVKDAGGSAKAKLWIFIFLEPAAKKGGQFGKIVHDAEKETRKLARFYCVIDGAGGLGLTQYVGMMQQGGRVECTD